ncbi:MAG: biotin--[acetyl-CoA-carboxylase] ligase [Sarcina sp.]
MNIQLLKENILDNKFKSSIIFYESIDSTNTYCKNNYSNLNDRSIIIAKEQTLGRGKNNRTWFSPKGGIYMSILLKDLNHISKIEILPLVTSLAIVKALKYLNISAMIKWPNDIIVNNRKAGGILVESKIFNGGLNRLVIGIGLNISSTNSIDELKNKFIALNDIITTLPSNEIIIANIINELNILLKEDTTSILNEYMIYSILQNKTVNLISNDNKITSVKVLGLNSDGSLKVQCLDSTKEFNIISGEFSITGLKDYI